MASAAARRAASSLLTAAARRAASSLLTAAAAATTTPLAAGPSTLTSAAATILGHVPSPAAAYRAATPLRLTGSATPRRLTGSATPLLLTGSATPPLLTGDATTITTMLAAGASSLRSDTAAILGRRALVSPAALNLHATTFGAAFSSPSTVNHHATRSFSATILGNRKAKSMLSRRGMATEALSPEVQLALQEVQKAGKERQADLVKQMCVFEVEIKSKYSAATISSAENALTSGKVAWRVTTAVLAFGIATLVAVLQTVKEGWKTDFKTEVKLMLLELVGELKAEIQAELREIARREIELVDAEKAAAKK